MINKNVLNVGMNANNVVVNHKIVLFVIKVETLIFYKIKIKQSN